MDNNTDNIREYKVTSISYSLSISNENKKQLYKISVKLEGETGMTVRDHRVMNRHQLRYGATGL